MSRSSQCVFPCPKIWRFPSIHIWITQSETPVGSSQQGILPQQVSRAQDAFQPDYTVQLEQPAPTPVRQTPLDTAPMAPSSAPVSYPFRERPAAAIVEAVDSVDTRICAGVHAPMSPKDCILQAQAPAHWEEASYRTFRWKGESIGIQEFSRIVCTSSFKIPFLGIQ